MASSWLVCLTSRALTREGHAVVFFGKTFTLTVSLSIQVYNGGGGGGGGSGGGVAVTLQWTSIPSSGK